MHGLKNVRHRHRDALALTDWAEVEALLAAHYRGEGWQVEHCGTGGTGACFDGGIDLRLRRDDALVLVQCKHWNAKQVPHNDVHQLLGLMVNEGATGAILVTSGEFTRVAREAAGRLGHVQLVDGHALRAMLGPLPEPARADDSLVATPPVAAAPDASVAPPPAELPPLEFRTPHSRRAAKPAPAVSRRLLWTLASIGFVLAMVLIFREILHKSAGSAGPEYVPPPPRGERILYVDPSGRPLPAPNVASGEAVVDWAGDASAATDAADDTQEGCRESLDGNGSYIDYCAQGMPAKPPTAAEVRASQRRADEAMKVIEAHTPEM